MPFVTSNDGVRLYYRDTGGDLPPIVMLHGWSQSSAVFERQWDALRERYRVIALDFRGHGESSDPGRGYRISRLAMDLSNLLSALDLRDVHLLGWSMGCAVAWSYWEMFRGARLRSFVFVDEAPWLLASYSIYESNDHTLDVAMLERLYMGLIGPEAEAFSRSFFSLMYSKSLPPSDVAKLEAQMLSLPRRAAALLLADFVCGDWRCAIESITLPTLVIGAEASLIKVGTQHWIARAIPGARLEVFERTEGGSHMMFYENPVRFNRVVSEHCALFSCRSEAS